MVMPKNGSYETIPQAREFYKIASNSDRKLNTVPNFFQSIGIKMGQSIPTIWHKLEQFSMFSTPSSFFLNITTFLKDMVTIHGRNNF